MTDLQKARTNKAKKLESEDTGMSDSEKLKEIYRLTPHEEGGSFSEVYTAPFEKDGRPMAGSIYFLLDRGEISHFHEIDCDELWFYHAGCGMRIILLAGGFRRELLLGPDAEKGQRAMAVIPAGTVFAAENLEADGFTFISCITTPQFSYQGFRLVSREELRERFPGISDDVDYLAFPEKQEYGQQDESPLKNFPRSGKHEAQF